VGNLDPQPVRSSETLWNKINLMRMLQIAALSELALCWIVWSLAFVKPSKQAAGQKEVSSAPVSHWGIFLVMVGFALVWAYVRPVGF
jgi:magnesium-transporting ATPase (P-type)